jgi:SAM-dependent methyltransferase
MATVRKPFQGIGNIIRFNWHFYFLAMLFIAVLWIAAVFNDNISNGLFSIVIIIMMVMLTSLIVSWYIYDYSDLYQLNWLDKYMNASRDIVNINAGFDEFSALIQERFFKAALTVFDFYDSLEQKEISIIRAQKAYPAFASTIKIPLKALPLNEGACDVILLLFAAHEIRSDTARADFFKELGNGLKPNGKIIVVEHLRNVVNFSAYTLGCFHFFSLNKWMQTFEKAQLKLTAKEKITPFITIFILQKDGNTF